MNTYKIAAILVDRGFNVKMAKVNKNGEQLDALIVGTAPVAACFYEKDFVGTEEQIANYITYVLNTTDMPDIDEKEITDWNNVKGKVKVGVRKPINDMNNVTAAFQDIQVYFYINVGDGIVKVNNDMLGVYGVTVKDLFATAVNNTAKEAEISNLSDLLFGPGSLSDDDQMFVITNADRLYGAGVILCSDVLDKACDKLKANRIYVIPSSIHEVLVVSEDTFENRNDLTQIITEVNEVVVKPEERLVNHPYIYIKGTGIMTV